MTIVLSKTKICTKCRKRKSLDDFYKNAHGPLGLTSACKLCCRAQVKQTEVDSETKHKYHLKHAYGLTVEQYNKMIDRQHGVCAICKRDCTSGQRLSVDHDHKCCPNGRSCGKCVRGLLCRRCNTLLGWYEKFTAPVERYLRKWKA